MEDTLQWKMTFNGRQPSIEHDLSIEDDIWWNTICDERQHLMKDDLQANTTFKRMSCECARKWIVLSQPWIFCSRGWSWQSKECRRSPRRTKWWSQGCRMHRWEASLDQQGNWICILAWNLAQIAPKFGTLLKTSYDLLWNLTMNDWFIGRLFSPNMIGNPIPNEIDQQRIITAKARVGVCWCCEYFIGEVTAKNLSKLIATRLSMEEVLQVTSMAR